MKRISKLFSIAGGNLAFGGTIISIYLFSAAIFLLTDIHLTGILAPCKFYAITGFLCPGCGGTRCVDSLLHFNFVDAFIFNPMAALIFTAIMVLAVYSIINGLRRPYKPMKYTFRVWHVILFACGYLFFFIIRNVIWFDING